MNTEHPITPPPELVQQWWDGTHGAFYEFEAVATQAARWGADQELQACCSWLLDSAPWTVDPHECPEWIDALLATRRPSMKERALQALENAIRPKGPNLTTLLTPDQHDTIRRALEALPDV